MTTQQASRKRPRPRWSILAALVACVVMTSGQVAAQGRLSGPVKPTCSSPRSLPNEYNVNSTDLPTFSPGCYEGPLVIGRGCSLGDEQCTNRTAIERTKQVYNDFKKTTETLKTYIEPKNQSKQRTVFLNGADVRGGVKIKASNITLDCGGGTIFPKAGGENKPGISVPKDIYLNNITIRNCNVLGFRNGVQVWPSVGLILPPDEIPNDIVISNSQLVGNAAYSGCYEFRNNTIQTINLSSNPTPEEEEHHDQCSKDWRRTKFKGIGVNLRARNSTIKNSLIGGFGMGIQLVGSHSNTIKSNLITANVFRSGIVIDASPMNEILGNWIHGNRKHGVALYTNCGEYGGVGPNGILANPWARNLDVPGYGKESSGRNKIIGNVITSHKQNHGRNTNGIRHSAGVVIGMRQGSEYNSVTHRPVTQACQGFKVFTHDGSKIFPAKGLCGCHSRRSHMKPWTRYEFDENDPLFDQLMSFFTSTNNVFGVAVDPGTLDVHQIFIDAGIGHSTGRSKSVYSGPHYDFAPSNNVSNNRFHDNRLGVLAADDGNSILWNDFDVDNEDVRVDAPRISLSFPANRLWTHLYIGDNERDAIDDPVSDIAVHHNRWPEGQTCDVGHCAVVTRGTHDLGSAGARDGSGRNAFNSAPFNGAEGITEARP